MGLLRSGADGDNKTLRQAALLVGVLVIAGFATGFAGGYIGGPGTGPESGEPQTLEQLAAKTGCKPQVISSKELRQGNCQTSKGKFVLMTFASDKGKETWLEGAKDYGGKYLVGTKWVIVGTTPSVLEPFRDEFGGQIQRGGHGPAESGRRNHQPAPNHN